MTGVEPPAPVSNITNGAVCTGGGVSGGGQLDGVVLRGTHTHTWLEVDDGWGRGVEGPPPCLLIAPTP